MPIAFFNSKGLMHHEYVLFSLTVNATFYLSALKQLVAKSHRCPRNGTLHLLSREAGIP